jgi:HAMP domain-containing protein
VSLSLRARLTLWYSAVVIVVLVSFTAAVSVAQRRFELSRIDTEVMRLSRMIEGVMRMEIRERPTLPHAAADTSAEIVAPDHALRLEREDGDVLVEWGVALPPSVWPRASDGPAEEVATLQGPGGPLRFFRRTVRDQVEPYVIVVAAPLQGLSERQREMTSAIWIGTLVALAVSALGGWLIARQTLAPLASMARQAAAASTMPETIRLRTPQPHDEPGRLAASFNALLDRISIAYGIQRQFMADASHELRTPISVIKTAAEATLSQPHRQEHEYRVAMTIVSAQSARLTRLVDDMLFLSRSDAGGLTIRHDAVHLDEVVAGAVASVKVVASDSISRSRRAACHPLSSLATKDSSIGCSSIS